MKHIDSKECPCYPEWLLVDDELVLYHNMTSSEKWLADFDVVNFVIGAFEILALVYIAAQLIRALFF